MDTTSKYVYIYLEGVSDAIDGVGEVLNELQEEINAEVE